MYLYLLRESVGKWVAGGWESMKKLKKQSLNDSFRHAFDGVFDTIRSERNMQIHIIMMSIVIIMGIILHLTIIVWSICFILFALVIGGELINTSLEAIVDLASPEYHPLAKKAKDTAAGAVLICAIFAAVIGLLLFVPKLL